MKKLTNRQQQVLDMITEFISENGIPPTRVEIAKQLGFKSANAAEDHLRALSRRGAIEMMPGSSRGIKVLQESGLPIVGKVAAGQPILSVENIDTHVPIQGDFFNPPADFLLKVEGESMREIGIMDGDLLAVNRTNNARNGEVVVARVDDEVTVKTFERLSDRDVVLHPENPDYDDINVDLESQDFVIEGKAVGVIRK